MNCDVLKLKAKPCLIPKYLRSRLFIKLAEWRGCTTAVGSGACNSSSNPLHRVAMPIWAAGRKPREHSATPLTVEPGQGQQQSLNSDCFGGVEFDLSLVNWPKFTVGIRLEAEIATCNLVPRELTFKSSAARAQHLLPKALRGSIHPAEMKQPAPVANTKAHPTVCWVPIPAGCRY